MKPYDKQEEDKNFIGEITDFLVKNATDNISKLFNLKDVLQYKYKPKKGVTEYEEVFRANKLKLLRFLPEEPKKYRVPLLFVYSLINRWYVVDLMEERSLMKFLSEQGYDVYITEWGSPSRSDKENGWDEYIADYMNAAVDYIRESTGQKKISIYGYCLGGTFCVIYSALFPEKVKNLLIMTTPVDFTSKGIFEKWSDSKYLDPERIIETFPIIPPDFLETSFDIKNIASSIWKLQTFWEMLKSPKLLKNYFAMEGWLKDNVPVSGRMWAQVIKDLYQENKLIKGKLRIDGENVDLSKITANILNIVGTKDNIIPPPASLILNDKTSSKDAKDLVLNAGHIGITTGGIAAKKLWPGVHEWLAPRSDVKK